MELESLVHKLSSKLDARIGDSDKTESAVLLIIHNPVTPSVVMTVKPQSMRYHGGEVAFPGGKLDDGDSDLLATALRESHEELGLEIERDDIVGQLSTVSTQSSGYIITPFVHITNTLKDMVPNTEVDEILCLPLKDLLDSAQTSSSLGLVFAYGGHNIWGASARILAELGHKTGLLQL